MIITPNNFGQQVLPKCQYFLPWISKTDQKRVKRQQLPFNMGRFCIMVVRMMIFGFEKASRVCYTLPKQSASYIQYFWKNHFSNNGKKSSFFNFFRLFIRILVRIHAFTHRTERFYPPPATPLFWNVTGFPVNLCMAKSFSPQNMSKFSGGSAPRPP